MSPSKFEQKGRKTFFISYRIKGKRITINSYIPLTQPKKAEMLKRKIESELRLLKRNQNDLIHTSHSKKIKLTLSECIQRFIDLNKVNWSKGRKKNVTAILKLFSEEVGTEKDIKDISSQTLANFIEIRKPIISVTSLRSDLQILRMFFNYTVEENWIQKSPVNKKFIPKPEHKAIITFNARELNLILEEAKKFDTQFFRYLFLLGSTGARPSDILNLSYDNFDLINNTLKIKISKTSREIVFPIYDKLKKFISTEYYDIDLKSPHDKLFTEFQMKTISRRFIKIKSKLLLKKEYNLKTFRKSFATSLIDEGIDVSIVAYLLGHTNVNTTSKYYINKNTDNIRISLNGLKL